MSKLQHSQPGLHLLALIAFALTTLVIATAPAQNGDRKGEVQAPPPPEWDIPEAPPLTPEEALKSFKLAEGFRIELVAAAPLAVAPVDGVFDAEGRLWIVEMRGYMPNIDGKDEDVKNGVIAVLEDTNNDGRMDKRTEFADDLVLPRALALHKNGVMFIEPPYLRYYWDEDGDLDPDDNSIIAMGFGGIHSPEHAANGLLHGRDNWIYLANHRGRLRKIGDQWIQEPTAGGGQWGITQDDWGRLYFNANSDQLRGDVIPTHYAVKNPNLGRASGTNLKVARRQETWPSRITPGVNRGYQRRTLRKDGTLASFTAACGPLIYRGNALGKDFVGNAFVCEPAGHLIKRNILREESAKGRVASDFAYEGTEFLTSTDERFRPVNMFEGPDGALYVVDMYRGVIQHRIFVTSYLRKQIIDRKLELPLEMGRIWRIVPNDWKRPDSANQSLASQSSEQLVDEFLNANAWQRETAQRLLVERQSKSPKVLVKLQALARSGIPQARVHALWTLEGLGAINEDIVMAALRPDTHPQVMIAGLRLSELILQQPGSSKEVSIAVAAAQEGEDFSVRRQRLLTLASLKADAAIAQLLKQDCSARDHRNAALSGLYQRESDLLLTLTNDKAWTQAQRGRSELFSALAKCILSEQVDTQVQALFSLIAPKSKLAKWQRLAIASGIANTRPAASKGRRPRPLRLERQPDGLLAAANSGEAKVKALAERILSWTTWPERSNWKELRLKPLSTEERGLFVKGKSYYSLTCSGCHQQNGSGMEGLAPPLASSEWVNGDPKRLVRILHSGLTGKISVRGREYNMSMPGVPSLSDDQVAAILTYARRSFGNEASPITPAFVAEQRKPIADRESPWTAEELNQ